MDNSPSLYDMAAWLESQGFFVQEQRHEDLWAPIDTVVFLNPNTQSNMVLVHEDGGDQDYVVYHEATPDSDISDDEPLIETDDWNTMTEKLLEMKVSGR